MKKILVVFLLLMMIGLAACGGKSGVESPTQSSAPVETGNGSSGEEGKEEVKVYGIGEVAETNGLAITIDKVVAPDPDILLNKAKDGFTYIQLYFTFKNVSDETIETPNRKSFYIVYEEGPTGDECDMTSDDGSNVLPGKKDDMYHLREELAPGESVSRWMIYQRQEDQTEVTMHYYSKFINVPPALVFRFTAE